MTAAIATVVSAVGLEKSFGATRALAGADLEVRPGEVHTVVGENGSGKSTLVKILAGVHRPDGGTLLVGGVSASGLRSPSAARALGIATVFQEVLTVPGRTVEENVCLGGPRSRGRAHDVLERLLGEPMDLDQPVDGLSLSGRQACCIARSLLTDPAVLVLDESTSALDIATRDRLFTLVRERTAGGAAVVFISHRMDEVFGITDVITVLRSGRTVAERIPVGEASVQQLVELMSGTGHRTRTRACRVDGPVALRATGVVSAPGAAAVDLDVHAGELVGLAGLDGQGQDAFLRALRGEYVAGSVSRTTDAGPVTVDGPVAARRLGVAYVPRERRHEALFEPLSVRENFALPTMADDTRGGLLDARRTDARLAEHVDRLKIQMRSPGDPVSTLSGGNQQKVVIARALAQRPAVLLLNDPTRGIDLGAKQDLYALLEELCAAGTAVVLLSSEVDELVELADRVLVFRACVAVTRLDRADLTRAAVITAYFGPQAGEVAEGV